MSTMKTHEEDEDSVSDGPLLTLRAEIAEGNLVTMNAALRQNGPLMHDVHRGDVPEKTTNNY